MKFNIVSSGAVTDVLHPQKRDQTVFTINSRSAHQTRKLLKLWNCKSKAHVITEVASHYQTNNFRISDSNQLHVYKNPLVGVGLNN